MRYLGGKARIAKHLIKCLPDAKRVWEPFCGGLNMTLELAKRYPYVLASDLHPGPIALGNGLKNGWVPPREFSSDDWSAAKHLPDTDPLKAFAGFGCSFAGIWFATYTGRYVEVSSANKGRPVQRDHPAAAAAFCERIRPYLCAVDFLCVDFFSRTPARDWLLYCDPPYEGTTGYETRAFDHAAFLDRCRAWARSGSQVFVSEYAQIPQARLVWEHEGKKCMSTIGGRRTERLYEITPPPRVHQVPRQLQLAL